jgi:2,3-bisphosphoglycerate-independent phosphoglycerate mutase
MILDGWGIGDKSASDAIFNGNTPYWDKLLKEYPHSELLTCGENVGLPDGQMGNSEVGHLNIGAGRIIYQDLVKINKAIKDKSFFENPELKAAFEYAQANNKKVHLLGLLSDGGVHSSNEHLYALCDMANSLDFSELYIHALMDGRDCDPKSGIGFMQDLQSHLKNSTGKVATVCGRYYTMDRDKRWERVKYGYDLMVLGEGEKFTDPVHAIETSYNNGITDEFIKPVVITDDKSQPLATIDKDDIVICFNFRTDRLREITTVLTQQDMPELGMQTLPLYYVTMTRYDDTFKNVKIAYDKDNVTMTLGEVISKAGKKQIRIAETEKYAHVTFFFSGGREKEFENEKRILIPSPKVATYDLQPEMSAYLVRDAIVEELNKQETDFICLNFANGDMVGHTGIMEAILKAVNAVDNCLESVVEAAKTNGYTVIIIADHGNADNAVNSDGSPNTAHSLNPVPIVIVDKDIKHVENGVLADVAPTILKIMELEQPSAMTGKALV